MVITLEDVTLRKEGSRLLNQINWQVRGGEHWALLGLNGSGKTLLLNIINGYTWPTTGKVSVLGKTFGTYPLGELRKDIGWVSTSFQEKLYPHEYAENIVLSGAYASIGLWDDPTDQEIDKAIALLEKLGCKSLIHRRYETLSQGEKQRILIARALMASPKLLILDEPCTGLDIFAKEQLLNMIAQVTSGEEAPTVLYVTHHVEEILPVFSHTLLLKKGEIFAADRKEHLLTSTSLSDFFEKPVHIEEKKGRYRLAIE